MTLTRSTPVRVTAALAIGTALAACDNAANDAVREGPQAVHPSPSALAQGTAATPDGAVYTPAANEGSQPIID